MAKDQNILEVTENLLAQKAGWVNLRLPHAPPWDFTLKFFSKVIGCELAKIQKKRVQKNTSQKSSVLSQYQYFSQIFREMSPKFDFFI